MTQDNWDHIRSEGVDGRLLCAGDRIQLNVRRNWHKGTKGETVIEGRFDYATDRGLSLQDGYHVSYQAIKSISRAS
jgi:hypothetical protein